MGIGLGFGVDQVIGGRGRQPLGRSDEINQSCVERSSRMRIGRPIGSAEHPLLRWSGDVPSTFVDQPMMDPAKEDEIVDVGRSAHCPGNDVVHL